MNPEWRPLLALLLGEGGVGVVLWLAICRYFQGRPLMVRKARTPALQPVTPKRTRWYWPFRYR